MKYYLILILKNHKNELRNHSNGCDENSNEKKR